MSVFSSGAPAQALAGDDSTAEATFLSGNLVSGLLAVDLGYIAASNDGTQTTQSAVSGIGASVDLSSLSLPLTLDADLLRTFAEAENEGSSAAAAGLIDVNGDFSSATPSYAPGTFSLDLTDALTDEFLTELAELKLDLGAISSRASIDAAGAPVGDYQIVGTQLLMTSNTLAGVVGTVNTAAGLVETEVDALVGPGGSILNELTGAVNGALSTLSLGAISANVSLDLVEALSSVLAGPLADGAVTLDLSTGTVAIDLDALNAGGLSSQPANTNILTTAQLSDVAISLDNILTGLQSSLNTVALATLSTATLNVDVDLNLLELDVADLTISGSLTDFASGTASANAELLPGISGITASIVSPLLGGVVSLVLDGLSGGLASVVTLLDPAGSILGGFALTITNQVVSPVSVALGQVFDILPALIELTVNNQEFTGTAPNQKFVETALRVDVLQGVVTTLNVAQSAVGPNQVGAIPAIADVDPTSGPVSGGTVVTLTGTDFGGSTGVTFDGIAGTEFTIVNDEQITVISPAHAAGAVDVIIQHPAGASDAGEFTFTPVPVISALTPDFGPTGGDTTVVIRGSDFLGATGVTFGGIPVSTLTIDSESQITVVTPAHIAGVVDVIVERASGNSLPADFRYLDATTVSGLTPDAGPLEGGTVVTITGTGFTDATGVTFAGVAGTDLTIVTDTVIRVTTPANPAGVAAVVVLHPIADVSAGDFTYTSDPTIASLTPTVGTVDGGTEVTIAGAGFTGATAVTFDGTPATDFTLVSDKEITVTTPAHVVGPVDVIVVHADGNSRPGLFTYQDSAPTVSGISPSEGPVSGGTTVTITGSGFTGATGVTFDGESGTSFVVVSDTEITVVTPSGAAGAAAVVVEHPMGDAAGGDFTYMGAAGAVVSSMFPLSGPDTGGTLVTLRGSGFLGATGVRFASFWGTDFTVISDTMATVVTPEHEAMWVPAMVASGALEVSTPGFTFELTTLALSDDDGLAFTGSSPTNGALLALMLLGMGAALLISRRPTGRHRA